MNSSGNCLFAEMAPGLPLHQLDNAIRVFRAAGFDVQLAKIGNMIVLAAMGSGYGTLAEIREKVRVINRMAYGKLHSVGHECFQEAHIFMAQEEKRREPKKELEKIPA